jgi:predicted ArsR family transcriptional regulator
LPEVVSTAEETMPNRLLERLGTIEGTGLEKLAVLLAERPDTTVDEAAMVLGLTRQTVKNYRHKLKASGGVIGEHNPAPAACVKG